MDTGSIIDLRSALEFLAAIPGQLATTRQPVDPHAELAAVYRRSAADPAPEPRIAVPDPEGDGA